MMNLMSHIHGRNPSWEYESRGYPKFVYEIWCSALGDLYVAETFEIPMTRIARIWMYLKAKALMFLFGWWWYRWRGKNEALRHFWDEIEEVKE
jgi:hypothetical protein